jgi:hypothetical protein
MLVYFDHIVAVTLAVANVSILLTILWLCMGHITGPQVNQDIPLSVFTLILILVLDINLGAGKTSCSGATRRNF